MHIYEGGDSLTMREHLKQIHNKKDKKKVLLDFSLYHHSCWLCMAFIRAKCRGRPWLILVMNSDLSCHCHPPGTCCGCPVLLSARCLRRLRCSGVKGVRDLLK